MKNNLLNLTRNKKIIFPLFILIVVVTAIVLRPLNKTPKPDELNSLAVTVKPNYDDKNRTLNGDVVDFSKCAPDVRRYDYPLGSMTVEVMGKKDDNCIVKYGSEIEHITGVRVLTNICLVPIKLKQGPVFTGNNVEVISKYCRKI